MILVSPTIAFIFSEFIHYWRNEHIFVAVAIGSVLSFTLAKVWEHNSYELEEVFARNGKLKPAGYFHGAYMIVAFAGIIMFYFCTPHVAKPWVWKVSAILALHILVGTFIPDYMTHRRIRKTAYIIVIVGWVLIAIASFNILHRAG